MSAFSESPGAYVIVARCGINNKEVPGQEGLLPNPAHAKSLALYVVDSSYSVDFLPLPPGSWNAMLKASGNEKAKKGVVIASNGKTQPILMRMIEFVRIQAVDSVYAGSRQPWWGAPARLPVPQKSPRSNSILVAAG